MTANKHNSENQGSKTRDHDRPRQHFLRNAHRDWRVWFAVVLMLGSMVIYIMSEDLSLRPNAPPTESMPADVAP
jgi:hypothetical protein